jgi:hypothetical protein
MVWLRRGGILAPRAGIPIYLAREPPSPSDQRMSIGFLRFLGVLLILGSIGFVTVKGSLTGGFRYLTPGFGQVSHVAAPDHR